MKVKELQGQRKSGNEDLSQACVREFDKLKREGLKRKSLLLNMWAKRPQLKENISRVYMQKATITRHLRFHYDQFLHKDHYVKSVQIRSFFWFVFFCIWIEYGPEKTPYLDTFHAVGPAKCS